MFDTVEVGVILTVTVFVGVTVNVIEIEGVKL